MNLKNSPQKVLRMALRVPWQIFRQPLMLSDPNESCDDMVVEFWLSGLGNESEGQGPMWRFSMKETLSYSVESDYSEEDQAEILKALEAVTEYVRAKIRRAAA